MAKTPRSRPPPYEQDDTYIGRPAKRRAKAATNATATAPGDPSPPSPAETIATSRMPRAVSIQGIWEPTTIWSQLVRDLRKWNNIHPNLAVSDRIIRFTSSVDREAWRGEYSNARIDQLCCTVEEAAQGFFQSRPKALIMLALAISDIKRVGPRYSMDTVHMHVVVVTREYVNGPQTVHLWDCDAFANFRMFGIKPKTRLNRSILPPPQMKLWDALCGTGDEVIDTWYGGCGNEWEFLKGEDQQLEGYDDDEDEDEEEQNEGRCAEASWQFIARIRRSIIDTGTWNIDPEKEKMQLMQPNYGESRKIV